MLLIVDRHNGIPAYRQIMDQVKFQIAAGRLQAGDPLPSTRVLSAQLAINPMTISKAYSLLEHEGVLERRPGMPLVVSSSSGDNPSQSRREQLRECLTPVAVQALQLGATPEEACEIFQELLINHRNRGNAQS